MTNQLQKIELENLERSESFQVNSLETANWAFKKLEALKAKEDEINKVAEKELERIKQWQSQELKSIENDKEYFEYLVTDYYKREKEKNDEVLEGVKMVRKPTSYTVKAGE